MIDTYAPQFIIEIGGREIPENISSHVESFTYEEDEKKMDELRITIARCDLDWIDNDLLQEGKEIRVKWGYIGNLSEVRECTIKEINYNFGNDGLLRIEIVAYDKRHRLTGRASRKCWKDKKLSEIVKDIADKHGFKSEIEIELSDDVLYDFLSEGAKNDLVFLKDIAEDAGCSVWVVNDTLYFKPNRVNEPVYKFIYRNEKDGYLRSFRISSKVEKEKGTRRKTLATGINPLSKEIVKESVTSGEG